MNVIERELLAIALYESHARWAGQVQPGATLMGWDALSDKQRDSWRATARLIYKEARTKP